MIKLATISLIATLAFAQQDGRLQFDWDKLAAKATETVDLNLDPPMLQMASKFLGSGDEAGMKALVGKLKGVFVKSFTFDKEGAYSEADVAAIRSQLRSPEWSKLLEAHDKKETSLIYIKNDGLVIFAAEPKEFTVIQILGPIDFSTLPALGGALGIPNMNFGPKPKTTPKKKED